MPGCLRASEATCQRRHACRTVLSDHIIPNYLRALESALEGMHRQAGVPVPPAADDDAAAQTQEGQRSQQQEAAQQAGHARPAAAASGAAASTVVQRGATQKVLPARGDKLA